MESAGAGVAEEGGVGVEGDSGTAGGSKSKPVVFHETASGACYMLSVIVPCHLYHLLLLTPPLVSFSSPLAPVMYINPRALVIRYLFGARRRFDLRCFGFHSCGGGDRDRDICCGRFVLRA